MDGCERVSTPGYPKVKREPFATHSGKINGNDMPKKLKQTTALRTRRSNFVRSKCAPHIGAYADGYVVANFKQSEKNENSHALPYVPRHLVCPHVMENRSLHDVNACTGHKTSINLLIETCIGMFEKYQEYPTIRCQKLDGICLGAHMYSVILAAMENPLRGWAPRF